MFGFIFQAMDADFGKCLELPFLILKWTTTCIYRDDQWMKHNIFCLSIGKTGKGPHKSL